MTVDFLDSTNLKSPVCPDILSITYDIATTIVLGIFDVLNLTSEHPAIPSTIFYL
jgi:hypothetical protein